MEASWSLEGRGKRRIEAEADFSLQPERQDAIVCVPDQRISWVLAWRNWITYTRENICEVSI